MPIYDYQCDGCNAMAEEYRHVDLRDDTAPCECGGTLKRAYVAPRPKGAVRGGRLSFTMGCTLNKIDAMERYLESAGVPTKFVRSGSQAGMCIIESAAHEAKIARARHMTVYNDGDKNGSRTHDDTSHLA